MRTRGRGRERKCNLADHFSRVAHPPEKVQAPCFLPVAWRDNAPGRGKGQTVESIAAITAIVLDLDDLDLGSAPSVLASVRALGCASAAWTTWSHRRAKGASPARDRLRVVLPLADPVDPEELRPLALTVARRLGVATDLAALDPGRVHFGPCALPDGEEPRIQIVDELPPISRETLRSWPEFHEISAEIAAEPKPSTKPKAARSTKPAPKAKREPGPTRFERLDLDIAITSAEGRIRSGRRWRDELLGTTESVDVFSPVRPLDAPDRAPNGLLFVGRYGLQLWDNATPEVRFVERPPADAPSGWITGREVLALDLVGSRRTLRRLVNEGEVNVRRDPKDRRRKLVDAAQLFETAASRRWRARRARSGATDARRLAELRDELPGRMRAPSPVEPGRARVERVDTIGDRLPPLDDLLDGSQGVVAIRAPMGVGKTEIVARHVHERPDLSVVAVSPLRVQEASLSQRADLRSYRATPEGEPIADTRLGIVLNSLRRIPPEAAFDLVVLDEIEALLEALDTRLLVDRRIEVHARLCDLVRRARHVVALDAGLSERALDWLRRVRPGVVRLIDCRTPPAPRALALARSREALVADLIEARHRGERCYVACDSLRASWTLARAVAERAPGGRTLVVSSDDSHERRAFFEAVERGRKTLSRHLARYDLVIVTPTVRAAASIEGEIFDRCFGLFSGMTVSPKDALQMIGRVRTPRDPVVRVFAQRGFGQRVDIEAMRRRQRAAIESAAHAERLLTDPDAKILTRLQLCRRVDEARDRAAFRERLRAGAEALGMPVLDLERSAAGTGLRAALTAAREDTDRHEAEALRTASTWTVREAHTVSMDAEGLPVVEILDAGEMTRAEIDAAVGRTPGWRARALAKREAQAVFGLDRGSEVTPSMALDFVHDRALPERSRITALLASGALADPDEDVDADGPAARSSALALRAYRHLWARLGLRWGRVGRRLRRGGVDPIDGVPESVVPDGIDQHTRRHRDAGRDPLRWLADALADTGYRFDKTDGLLVLDRTKTARNLWAARRRRRPERKAS